MASTTFLFQDMGELQKVFNQFDTNGDGKISSSELGGVLKAMGSAYTSEDLDRVVDEADTDKDWFISLDEFSSLCRPSADADTAAEELKDAFDLYDQNKNGLISKTELHQVLTRLGMPCSVEDCVKMIQTVDSDGDGCVNFDEFKQMMAAKNGQN